MKIFLSLIFLWTITSVFSQSEHIDVQHYLFRVAINDSTDLIEVGAGINLSAKKDLDSFTLELYKFDDEGKGMQITSLPKIGETLIRFKHVGETITFYTPGVQKDSLLNLYFEYKGIPANGLIIGENRHGQRTFFADHWPNRAHHWLACVDHPSEKARISFSVIAPEHYEVVATGELTEKRILPQKRNLWNYRCMIPLPIKVQVIGAADMVFKELKSKYQFPITSWVYVEDNSMITDLDVAVDVAAFFEGLIGRYPYEKLANVQSTTMFGGMENAGNIFYDENAFTGKGSMEALIAHEIAHQWFGNSASETDWQHLWLSEGFATYLTNIYMLEKHGVDIFTSRMKKEREQVIQFYERQATPVVDSISTDLMSLLNPNSYQKGAWVLHMLRNKLGNKTFFDGIRAYYKKYALSNASTEDFKAIMEEVSGSDLDQFFSQWLYTAGHPLLKVDWTQKKRKFEINIRQQQTHYQFKFPLEIRIEYSDGTSETRTFAIDCKEHGHFWKLAKKKTIQNVVIDPDTKLLFYRVNP